MIATGAPAMRELVDDLAAEQTELDDMLTDLDARGWHTPTRCDGWDVADVVLHLAQTNELAVASATGRFGDVLEAFSTSVDDSVRTIDDAAAWRVERERGVPTGELLARWRASASGSRDALLACDPGVRLTWVAGELSARTLATTRLAETWIHTGDVADALGVERVPSDRLLHIARLAWRTLPYAFMRADRPAPGPVAFDLVGPGGDRWQLAPEGRATADTVISGPAVELCAVAARRVAPEATSLVGRGPDAASVLELMRTYA